MSGLTFENFRKMATKSAKDVSTDFTNYNKKCNDVIDIIYDKVIELMSKDAKINPVKKKAIVKGVIWIKEPIKEYIVGMPKEDARDVISRVLEIVRK